MRRTQEKYSQKLSSGQLKRYALAVTAVRLTRQPHWIARISNRVWLETKTTSNVLRMWLAVVSPIVGLGIDWLRRRHVPDWESVFWSLTLGPIAVFATVFLFNFSVLLG